MQKIKDFFEFVGYMITDAMGFSLMAVFILMAFIVTVATTSYHIGFALASKYFLFLFLIICGVLLLFGACAFLVGLVVNLLDKD